MTRDKLPAWGTDISSPHSWQIFTTFSNTNLSAKKYIKKLHSINTDSKGSDSDIVLVFLVLTLPDFYFEQ